MSRTDQLAAWVIGVAGAAVYLLTQEPTASFWDCGEFIATSYGLQVGHPPGAPTYNLIARCLMLLAGSDTAMIAWWGNALSAIAGGATAGLLYATIVRMSQWSVDESRNEQGETMEGTDKTAPLQTSISAAVGALCYLFCDTAWFSATESEVYSLATLFSATIVWSAVRMRKALNRGNREAGCRWLTLIGLLSGLGIGVHQLTLLALPTAAVTTMTIGPAKKCLTRIKEQWATDRKRTLRQWLTTAVATVFFFALGLSTYCTVAIRAAAKPEICYGDPATKTGFVSYVKREQYEKAPLWPRSWRMRPGDENHYAEWQGKGGDLQLLAGYQIGYMYFRYLMWNFSGRFNDRQGFGGLQNGQLITGIGPADALIVGSGMTPPKSIGGKGHNRYYMLPLVLGLIGAVSQWRRHRKAFHATMTLFLMGGIVLGLYINHPVYEPRERDYAYILSFYAYSVWIAFGAMWIGRLMRKWFRQKKLPTMSTSVALLGIPALMACQNWDDHDRSGRYLVRDMAANMLNSCERDAILITYGDNDTFPLWYAQQVEDIRRDVTVANVNINGGQRWLNRELEENNWQRPVYFSNYMRDFYGKWFEGRLQLEGMCYRLCPNVCDTIGVEEFYSKIIGRTIEWHNPEKTYIDPVGLRFIEYYWWNVVKLSKRLATDGDTARSSRLLETTAEQLPTQILANKRLVRDIARAWRDAGQQKLHDETLDALKKRIAEEEEYYKSIRPGLQQYVMNNYHVADDFWED